MSNIVIETVMNTLWHCFPMWHHSSALAQLWTGQTNTDFTLCNSEGWRFFSICLNSFRYLGCVGRSQENDRVLHLSDVVSFQFCWTRFNIHWWLSMSGLSNNTDTKSPSSMAALTKKYDPHFFRHQVQENDPNLTKKLLRRWSLNPGMC